MKTIGRIEYFDPYFIYTDDYLSTNLLLHEAYGYVTEKDGSYVLEFITEPSTQEIIKGVIIPKEALASEVRKHEEIPKFRGSPGDTVRLLWKDIVYAANTDRITYSIMETTGVFVGNHQCAVVIRNPQTIRKQPLPHIKNPEDNPSFYLIPVSLITHIEQLP